MDNTINIIYTKNKNTIKITKTKKFKKKHVINVEIMSMKCFRSMSYEKTYIKKYKKIIKNKKQKKRK